MMKTFEDPIVKEVREIRRRHAEQHGYDLDSIVAALQARERKASDIVQPNQSDPGQRPPKTVFEPGRDGCQKNK